MSVASSPARRFRVPGWVWLLIATAAAVTSFELVLLSNVTGLFTHGFNSGQIRDLPGLLAFVVLSLALDVAYQLGLWVVLVPLLRAARIRPLQAGYLLFVVGFAVAATQGIYRFGLFSIVGDMLDQRILSRIALGSSSPLVLEAFDRIPVTWVVVFGLAVPAAAIGYHFAGRIDAAEADRDAGLALPGVRRLLVGFAVLFVFAAGASQLVPRDSLRFGAARKSSGALFEQVLTWLTDFDVDGYGLISAPLDPAPFDGARTPYTTEVAGNGRDENGLGGDLPADFTSPSAVAAPPPDSAARPHLLIIYLESFRYDALDSVVNGRAVTPALDELARTGASTAHAYSHVGWTISSRAQLFNGVTVPAYDQPTLIDDFKELGYHVGYFSGQDESFGRSEGLTGARRADAFYDARDDVERRTSRSTAPSSLQVSWKTLDEHVGRYLDALDPSRPQLLYVNIVDTHYPYTHGELDDILGVPALSRDEIRAESADRVRAGYANAAANVDHAVGRIVERWRSAIGNEDHGILVLSDHGESIYDEGVLGHGLTIDVHSTRVPFIVWGIGGVWPEPLAPSDVRWLLRRNLFVERDADPPRARFERVPGRSILQYAPNLVEPARIGLRTVGGVAAYDFLSGDYGVTRSASSGVPDDAPEVDQDAFEALIWRWEEAQAERQRFGRLR